MSRRLPLVAALCALSLAAACGGGSPTAPAPPPAPSLTVDQDSLVVPRHRTGQLHASFGLPGAQHDVTSAATWSSSNPAIVTVDAGLVTAKNIGTASVTADYQGQRQTVAITARRRTRLVGTITVNDPMGQRTVASVTSYVDGAEAGSVGTSQERSSLTVTWGGDLGWILDPLVDPGSHTVSVAVGMDAGPHVFVTDVSSHVVVIDIDTGETVASIPLPVQSKSLADIRYDRISWTVRIDAYSS